MYKGSVLWDTTVCTLATLACIYVQCSHVSCIISCSMNRSKMYVHSVRLKICVCTIIIRKNYMYFFFHMYNSVCCVSVCLLYTSAVHVLCTRICNKLFNGID